MVTDLSVVVANMLQGPAGLLRNSRFFASEPALRYVDRVIAEEKKKQARGAAAPPPPPLTCTTACTTTDWCVWQAASAP